MAALTVRDLDDPLKRRLRLRAAARNRSMAEVAHQMLRAALQESLQPTLDLGARIRGRFAALGDVQLPIEAREPVRSSPVLATRNVGDFEGTGVVVVDPWASAPGT